MTQKLKVNDQLFVVDGTPMAFDTLTLEGLAINRVTGLLTTGSVLATQFFGVDPTGTLDSTVPIQRAIDYCIANNVRRLAFPDGIYLISSMLRIVHGKGLAITGVSVWATSFHWAGSGTQRAAFQFYNCRECVVERFEIRNVSNPPTKAFIECQGDSNDPLYAVNGPTGMIWRNLQIAGNGTTATEAGIMYTYETSSSAVENDFGKFEHVLVDSVTNGSGFQVGDSAVGGSGSNMKSFAFSDCEAQSCTNGLRLVAGSFDWQRGFMALNSAIDFRCDDVPDDPVRIAYCESELSRKFYEDRATAGTPSGLQQSVTLSENRITTFAYNNGDPAITCRHSGPLKIEGGQLGGISASIPTIEMAVGAGAFGQITVTGVSCGATGGAYPGPTNDGSADHDLVVDLGPGTLQQWLYGNVYYHNGPTSGALYTILKNETFGPGSTHTADYHTLRQIGGATTPAGSALGVGQSGLSYVFRTDLGASVIDDQNAVVRTLDVDGAGDNGIFVLASAPTVETLVDLMMINGGTHKIVQVMGQDLPDDTLGGDYVWAPFDTTAVSSPDVLAPNRYLEFLGAHDLTHTGWSNSGNVTLAEQTIADQVDVAPAAHYITQTLTGLQTGTSCEAYVDIEPVGGSPINKVQIVLGGVANWVVSALDGSTSGSGGTCTTTLLADGVTYRVKLVFTPSTQAGTIYLDDNAGSNVYQGDGTGSVKIRRLLALQPITAAGRWLRMTA